MNIGEKELKGALSATLPILKRAALFGLIGFSLYVAVMAAGALIEGHLNQKKNDDQWKAFNAWLTYGTDYVDYEYVYETSDKGEHFVRTEDLEKGFGILQRRTLISDAGKAYVQYRLIRGLDHQVMAVPREGFLTTFSFWKYACNPGERVAVQAASRELNQPAELVCLEMGGATWISRYAIWKSGELHTWNADYGGFKVRESFDWDMSEGVRLATMNGPGKDDKALPEAIF